MSITVMVIGALHALPPFIIGAVMNSRIALMLATTGTALVAVNTGSGRYTAVDLFFAMTGAVLGWITISEKKKNSMPAIYAPKPGYQTSQKTLEPETSIEERRMVLVQDAEDGNQEAQLFLSELLIDDGNIYSASSGQWRDLSFPRDMSRGFFWLNKAIDRGDVSTNQFVPNFCEQVLRVGEIDKQYLSCCIDAASRVEQKGGNDEERESLGALMRVQQIVMTGELEEAQSVVKKFNDAYRAKYVKVNPIKVH